MDSDQSTVLNTEQLEEAVRQLNVGWSVLPGKGLVRVFETGDFAKGFGLVSAIAELAEAHQHFPEITLRGDEVEVTLNTFEAGGVTRQDTALASAIDTLSS